MIGSFFWKATRTASLIMIVGLAGSAVAEGQTESTTKAKSGAEAKGKSKSAEKAEKKKGALLDLNKATAEEMVEELPGVGETTAKKIVAGRPYSKVEDLLKAGVPLRTVDGIRPLVIVKAMPEERAKPKEKTASKTKSAMPKEETAKASKPGPLSDSAKVNLNTGKLDELQSLPGIGEVTAKAIVAARPFKTIDELDKVKGLGKTKIEALRHLVIVTAPAAEPAEMPKEAVAKKGRARREESNVTEKAATEKPAEKAVMEKPAAKEKTASKEKTAIKPGEIVNINTASKDALDQLPGIGPVKAQAILDARPFKTKEDIMKVKGIKEGEFGKIKDMIRVD